MTLTHHAYYLEGSTELMPAVEAEARAALGFSKGSPDVRARAYEKFGIDDAHALRAQAALKPTEGKALFVVAAASMTTESQQALLKLLEEPSPGTVLILIVPHGTLLPTVRSRCLPLPLEAGEAGSSKDAKDFLKASGKERSELVAELLEEEEGTRQRAREFLEALERELYAAFGKKSASADARAALARGLEDVALFRKYLADRSPSLKMLLEHLAAVLPKLP